MTIHAYTGLPGSGKSLQAVGHDIVNALKERRLIVTNIPLNLEALADYARVELAEARELVNVLDEDQSGVVPFSSVKHFTDYESWKSEGKTGNGPLYVVDECHESFAELVGLKGEGHPIALWMATHRHKGADVVLITQDKTGIPPAIRRRCEFIYEYRSMKALGMPSRYARLTFLKRGGHAVDRTYGKYKKEWFGLYKSHGAGVAEKLSKPKNILFNWRILLVLVGIPVALYFAFSGGVPSLPGYEAVSSPTPSDPPAKSSSIEKALSNVAGVGQEAEITSPQIDAMKQEIQELRLSQQLTAMKSAALRPGGELVPAADGSGVVFRQKELEQTHALDGFTLQISGYMMTGGRAEYWLSGQDREGHKVVKRSADLSAVGLKVHAIDQCNALAKTNGATYRLSCDVPFTFPAHLGADRPLIHGSRTARESQLKIQYAE